MKKKKARTPIRIPKNAPPIMTLTIKCTAGLTLILSSSMQIPTTHRQSHQLLSFFINLHDPVDLKREKLDLMSCRRRRTPTARSNIE